MFLTWYSPEAIAASLPSGLLLWTVTSLFIGIAAYVNTFVAQYFGAKEFDELSEKGCGEADNGPGKLPDTGPVANCNGELSWGN